MARSYTGLSRVPNMPGACSPTVPGDSSVRPVVAELELDADVERLEQRHRRLQIVLARRADAHGVTLDRRLHAFHLGVLDRASYFARQVGGESVLDRDRLPRGGAARGLD